MPLGEALDDDDYVIRALKRDAGLTTSSRSSDGGSLLSRRSKPRDAPKPNTRFLKSLIRDTDSHNAALRAREAEESGQRLRDLKRGLGDGKRRRDDDGEGSQGKKVKNGERQGRWASALAGLGGAGASNKSSDLKSRRDDVGESDRGERRQRDRSRERRHKHDRDGRLSRNHRSTHSTSPDHRKKKRRRSSSNDAHSPVARAREQTRKAQRYGRLDGNASDSDPLESVRGPAPPPSSKARGRGAFKSSGIESRFASDYNPKTDVSLDQGEQDDWDMALEALRDRAKWQAQGADRLKAAGFTEAEVKRWEKGGELDVTDVRWRKKGEGREWDAGKAVDEEGEVSGKADWAK